MTRVCPNCENVVSNEVMVCPYCRTTLSKPKVEVVEKKKYRCPRCKKEIFVTSGRCPHCNLNLDKEYSGDLKSYYVTRALIGAIICFPCSLVLFVASMIMIAQNGAIGFTVMGVAVFAFIVGIANVIYYNKNKYDE
ncbi:MAG: zinc ribbon domain-containing protein [Acholeplasmatales bacterium]|nr:zinc ribbon domain-containing protein [Acholeplasmatales bacterium]